VPRVRDIHTHIEPIAAPVAPVTALGSEEEEDLRVQIAAVAKEVPGLRGYDRLHIRSGPDGYDVALHCLADPDLSVTQAHRLADEVEKRLQTKISGISRVLVHVEPEGEN
jgi:divalent metal cation (Fe/Co/Zn/Cd) transporter